MFTLLSLATALHARALVAGHRFAGRAERLADQRGQTSAEYALVLLGAASVALLIAVWARNSNRIGRLLNAVFDHVIQMVR
jgi:Flp pilus assembly pilin Flp